MKGLLDRCTAAMKKNPQVVPQVYRVLQAANLVEQDQSTNELLGVKSESADVDRTPTKARPGNASPVDFERASSSPAVKTGFEEAPSSNAPYRAL